MRLIEADVTSYFAWGNWLEGLAFPPAARARRDHGKVACSIKVRHTCRVVGNRISLCIANDEVTVLLVEIGYKEIPVPRRTVSI